MFLVSRVLYILIAGFFIYTSDTYIDNWNYSNIWWLSVWGRWDTGWYLDIAINGYSQTFVSELPRLVTTGQTNVGFFPLYPLLIRFVAKLLDDYYVSSLVISNFSFLAASFILYKLVKYEFDQKTALKAVKFLYLFPTSFILSGAFSESLFLVLLVACFYFARKKKWLITSVFGFFLSLTRPEGFLVSLPLLFEYVALRKSIKNFSWDFISLSLIPAGTLSFMVYTKLAFNDYFAYFNTKVLGWSVHRSNPIYTMNYLLFSKDINLFLTGIYVLSLLFLTFFLFRKLKGSYIILTILLLTLPLFFNGIAVSQAIPRHYSVIFPFFILIAQLVKKSRFKDIVFSSSLILIQIFFLILWLNGGLTI